MAFPAETRTTPAPKEEISPKILAAAKRVSVGKYLQVRFQKGGVLSDLEEGQMLDAADIIRESAEREGKTYRMGDEIGFSGDLFGLVRARNILKNVPLAEYLAARQVALQGQLDWNFEKIGFFGGQDLIEKGKRMTQELLLTLAVAEAADVSFA